MNQIDENTPDAHAEEILKLEALQKQMEEMAGLPREKLGERQPGERGSYEMHKEQVEGL